MKSRILLVLAGVGILFALLAAVGLLHSTASSPAGAAPPSASSPPPATQPSEVRDDSSYVQTSINAAIAGHRPLVLPARRFFIGSTLTIQGASGLVIQGAGTPVSPWDPRSGW